MICMNPMCAKKGWWTLLRQVSKFADWQRVRMQETSKEIPARSIPRSIDVILRHDIVEQARAGDTVIFTGTRGNSGGVQEGVKGLRTLGVRDLSFKLAFIANSMQICNGRRDADIRNRKRDAKDGDTPEFTSDELAKFRQMRNTLDFFNKLVDSLASTVFTHEGINLRGDINVCFVRDPSYAKSRFLKCTTTLVSRSVYRSGKSSSAAGLTATVGKEPETSEFCIE
nr:DNA replication licensing factor MCM6 [Tanacetum cinerariifolium]